MSPELLHSIALAIAFSLVDSFAMAIKKIQPLLFVPFTLIGQIGTIAVSSNIPVGVGIALGGSRHIWNLLFAAFMLREPVVAKHFLAVFVIFIGIMVCYQSAYFPTEEPLWNADVVYGFYTQTEYYALHAVNVGLIVWSVGKIRSGNLLQQAGSRADAIPLLVLSNVFSGYSCPAMRAVSGQAKHVFSKVLVASADAADGGVLMKITQPWILTDNERRELFCLVFTFGFYALPFSIASLWFLDRALLLYPALFVTTGTYCLASVWQLTNGMILFREWELYSLSMAAGTCVGLGLQLLGVWMNYTASEQVHKDKVKRSTSGLSPGENASKQE